MIPNGFDTQRFRPDDASRQQQRRRWDIGDDDILIGIVGRLDPIKNHPAFLQAAALLARERQRLRFVCVGQGDAAYTHSLQALAHVFGIEARVSWINACTDMPAAYNALDMLVSASHDEAFSGVIGEAMACGVPCVVTDVGDSALLVGATGAVVPRDDPSAIAQACNRILAKSSAERAQLAAEARDRVVHCYSREALIQHTHDALEALV